MYFSEKGEDNIQNDISGDVGNDDPINKPHALYGINKLSDDMTSALKKVAFVYKSTLEFKNVLNKKNDIIKGAVTQSDIQSMIKIISQDINVYMKKMHIITNQLRKSYLELENKINIILVSAEMDAKYTSVFNKSFFNKTLNVYMDRYIHEKVNSGIFLIKLSGMEEKTDTFIDNIHNSMLTQLYPELRYLDVVAYMSDNVFAVFIADISKNNFMFMVKQIAGKIKSDNFEQAISAGMLGQFDNNKALMVRLEENLKKVKNISDDFIFA